MKVKKIISLLFVIIFLPACAPKSPVLPETLVPAVPELPVQTPTLVPSPTSTLHPSRVPVLNDAHVSGWVVYSVLVSVEPWITIILLKNLDTGAVTQLTNLDENADDPIWSPDGKQILYLAWTEGNSYDLYLMDKNGKNKRPLVASPAADIMADWSPDGKKIAYVSRLDDDAKIFIIDLQTQDVVQLTNDSMRADSPKWSSDGREISFISNSSENKLDTRSQVFIMNADGTNIRQMMKYNLDNFDDSPVWCPDDSCIVFTRDRGPLKLMILDISSKNVVTLLDKVFGPEIQEADIARSPVRGYITFQAGSRYYAMNMKTGDFYPLNTGGLHLSLYP